MESLQEEKSLESTDKHGERAENNNTSDLLCDKSMELNGTNVMNVTTTTDKQMDNITRNSHRKSQRLSVVLPTKTRARSPVTVQEWVAALPDQPEEHTIDEPLKKCDIGSGEEEEVERDQYEKPDNLTLGAEAGCIMQTHSNMAKLLLDGHRKGKGAERKMMLQHADTSASFKSNTSSNSTSSVESFLFAREPDPEEVLLNLGFGGSESLSKIPDRFLAHRSNARGISIARFIKREEDIMNRRPSALVEKIIQTLKEQERELRRRNSSLSWTSTSSFAASAIPSRFKIMDPQRPTFESIVEAVIQKSPRNENGGNRNKTFKTIAKSVLAAENRTKSEANQCITDEKGAEKSDVLQKFDHQNSRDSLISNVSLDSDWSDEEREELEKLFGEMSLRGEELAKIRKLKRSIRKRTRSQGPPSSCTPSWDGSKLIYSRESSMSELSSHHSLPVSNCSSEFLKISETCQESHDEVASERKVVNRSSGSMEELMLLSENGKLRSQDKEETEFK